MIERVSERFSPMDVAVSTICRWGAVLRSRGSLSAWSARDLHRLLKIIAALLAWKLLSIDYSALVDLVGRPPLRPATTPWLRSAVAWVHTHVAVSETVILGVQWFASAGLVLGVFFRQRWLAAIGWLGSLALFVSAHQYVGWMFDIELCCVLLLLVIVWPERWSTLLNGATHVSRSASAMAWSIQLYLGLAYFFTGWSKLHFNLVWIQQIRLEYLHPVMDVWHGSNFNLLGIPRGFHELLMAYPALGIVMALVTLFTELFWITALVSRRARFWLPLVMFATHTGIFFSSGILFLHLAVIQLAAVAPWQRGWYPWRRTVAALTVTPPTLGWRFATGSLAAFAASMAMVPAVTHWNLAWLPDWNQFGWSYAGVTQPQVYYRVFESRVGPDRADSVESFRLHGFSRRDRPGRVSQVSQRVGGCGGARDVGRGARDLVEDSSLGGQRSCVAGAVLLSAAYRGLAETVATGTAEPALCGSGATLL